MEDLYQFDQEYRDHISTVDASGKRVWVFPKKPKGKYHTLRVIVAVVLLFLLFAGPFIKIDGHPFLLFNIIDRRFIIFGTPFWPQDFHLLVLAFISLVLFIVLFTVIYGRVWCGWACPQTIFMEMVFRKIEYWIEGDSNKQRKLDKTPWNSEKIFKTGLKQLIFVIISLVIAHLFMAYIIGLDQVYEIVSQSPMNHLAGFAGLMLFTFLFYFVFANLREQVCIVLCPYGRLQGVFVGQSTIAVMYDWLRGEPRGRIRKNKKEKEKGDCIDCKMCVHVCPTGIDIRNGTQLECINCTACMDACDDVMTKIKRPEGLIRLASYQSIKEGVKNLFTTRVTGYSVVLIFLVVLQIYLLTTREPVETTILRVPGMLYQEQENNRLSNLYNIQFVNKTFEEITLDIRLKDFKNGEITRVGGETISIPSNENVEGTFFIELPREEVIHTKTNLVIEVLVNNEVIDEVKTNFLGPVLLK
jgi:cytochrome c oxidase accessory protein FixG